MDNGAYEKYKAEIVSRASTISRPGIDQSESEPLKGGDLALLAFFFAVAIYAVWQVFSKYKKSHDLPGSVEPSHMTVGNPRAHDTENQSLYFDGFVGVFLLLMVVFTLSLIAFFA